MYYRKFNRNKYDIKTTQNNVRILKRVSKKSLSQLKQNTRLLIMPHKNEVKYGKFTLIGTKGNDTGK